jgi:HEAT repeat protein
MVHQSPAAPATEGDAELDCEPELVLQIALETGSGGPRVDAAFEALIAERRIPSLLELLGSAPDPAQGTADTLWQRLATPARLRAELSSERPDFLTVEGLVSRLGPMATEPLLDLLERSTSASIRGRTLFRSRALRLLSGIGSSVAPAAVARLKNAPWYVQRNLLVLLRTLGTWPSDFSATPFARDPEPRVRREAYKLLLAVPQHRSSAILHGLDDSDGEIVTLVLRAAVEDCPREALGTIERFTEDWRRPAEQRALAVRALGRGGGPQALGRLVQLAGARRSFLGWRLDASSPVALAAVSALARHFGAHPQVTGLLEAARAHSNPDVRLAARMRPA